MSSFRPLARRLAKEAFCVSLQAASLVDRTLRYDPKLQWLLILTMPNSGSTALGKLLMTARAAVALTERCEGEWLIPSMSNLRTRWDDRHRLSMGRVRARWMARLRNGSAGAARLVVEKSPPNMVRIDQLRAALAPMRSDTIILVRDPYAVCESWHRRYGREQLAQTSMPELTEVDDDDDHEYFRLLGRSWAIRARYLASQKSKALSVVRYERLVAEPAAVVEELAAKVPLLSDVDPAAQVKVKDYERQGLTDMNERQIAALSDDQVAAISRGLEQGREAVAALGYAVR